MGEPSSGTQLWNNVYESSRSSSVGQLRAFPDGLTWRKSGGGAHKEVSVSKADIHALSWTRIPGSYQLAVELASGATALLVHGLRESDKTQINAFATAHFPSAEKRSSEASVLGRNWGEASVRPGVLAFTVGGKPGFRLATADISGVTQTGRTDVLVQLGQVDDLAKGDALVEIAFHVPVTSGGRAADADDEAVPLPAKVLADQLLSVAAVGPASGEPLATFADVACLLPRGRFELEMHVSQLRLASTSNDFKVPYASILRLYVLPKPQAPQTLAILALDPPIRRGATYYPHLVLQFSSNEEVEMEPSVPPELVERLAGKLEPKYAGAEADVFTKVLKALGGTKVTRQGSFVSPQGGCAVRCVHKADDGHLYPLEKAFFFLPKPPVLIRHDDITEIAFERTAGGATGTSSKTFDIKLTTSNAAHRFSGIARAEYDNLVAFLQAKKLPVEGLATDGPRQAQFEGDKEDDSEDHYDARIRGEAGEDEEGSEEDADFKAEDVGGGKADSGGSPSDSSEKEEGEGGEGGDGGGDGAEGGGGEKKAKKPKAPAKRKEKEPSSAAVGKDGKEKKKRPKKDKNAPKGALSAYMYFNKANNAAIKAANPGIAFAELSKKIGEAWKALSKEDKEPYESQAKEDKARAKKEMDAYKASGGASGGGAAKAGAAKPEEAANDAADEEAEEAGEAGDDMEV